MKVVFVDYVKGYISDYSLEEKLFREAGHEIVLIHCNTEKAMPEEHQNADAVLAIGLKSLSAVFINSLANCKVIVRYGIGVDCVDLPAATERGIMVCNMPDYCIPEVATHALALMLDCLRMTTRLNNSVKIGAWHPKFEFQARRLSSLTLGFAGFGGIARQLAAYAKPLGFSMVAYDPYLPRSVFEEHGVQSVDLAELCMNSDVVSIHAPLTDETFHMFNKKRFVSMKDGAIIVNTSRGSLICEDDLIEAIESGKLGGAGLDVLETEPMRDANSRIFSFDNVIITPHLAFSSQESFERLRIQVVDTTLRALNGDQPPNTVNKAALSA